MWRVDLARVPAGRALGHFRMSIESRIRKPAAANERTRQFLGRRIGAVNRISEVPYRRRPEMFDQPAHVAGIRYPPHLAHDRLPWLRRKARHAPAVPFPLHQGLECLSSLGGDQIEHRLPVLRHEGVQIDDECDPVRYAIGDSGDDGPGRTVAYDHDVVQRLQRQHVDDIGDMDVKADVRASEMAAFAKSGQRRREDAVPSFRQKRNHFLPEPRAVPGRMNEDECFRLQVRGHGFDNAPAVRRLA
jgi:hypothetical protein